MKELEKSFEKMLWYIIFRCVVLEILRFDCQKQRLKMLTRHFFLTSKPQNHENYTSKYNKP